MSPRPNDDDEELRFQTKSQGSRNCESEVGDKTDAYEVLKRKETFWRLKTILFAVFSAKQKWK